MTRQDAGGEDAIQILRRWAKSTTASHRLVLRSRIVLRLLAGQSQVAIARELQVSRDTVARWHRRFEAAGVEGLMHDKAGRGRRPGRDATNVDRVLAVLREPVPSGATRWTVRLIATRAGVSASTVQRILRDRSERSQLTGQILTQAGSDSPRRAGSPLASATGGPLAVPCTPPAVAGSPGRHDWLLATRPTAALAIHARIR